MLSNICWTRPYEYQSVINYENSGKINIPIGILLEIQSNDVFLKSLIKLIWDPNIKYIKTSNKFRYD